MRFVMPLLLLTLFPALILSISTPSFAGARSEQRQLVASSDDPNGRPSPQTSLAEASVLPTTNTVNPQPPTRESLEKLFTITDVAKRLDSQYSMMLPFMTKLLKKSLPPGADSAEANRIFNEVFAKEMKLFREEMGWSALKEDYIKMYSTSFSQAEIDGLINFYESPTGKSYLEKIPLITQKSRDITEQKFELLLPKLKKIIEDSVKDWKVKPAVKKR
jgi:uncharacterized protein